MIKGSWNLTEPEVHLTRWSDGQLLPCLDDYLHVIIQISTILTEIDKS